MLIYHNFMQILKLLIHKIIKINVLSFEIKNLFIRLIKNSQKKIQKNNYNKT